jgi:hypothetical protein
VSTPGPPPPRVCIELVEEEVVVEHGTRRVVWFVRHADAWEHASAWPGTVTTQRDAGPGTVWERVLELEVPIGTPLMRVETRPAPAPPRNALDYLRQEQRVAARHVRRAYFRADAHGRLARVRHR